jgi:hypothetical protein
MYTNKEDEGEERRKRKMEWVGSWSAAAASGELMSAPAVLDELLMSGWTRSRREENRGVVFVERTKTCTMMPPHIHETSQYQKSQIPCHTDHSHVLK